MDAVAGNHLVEATAIAGMPKARGVGTTRWMSILFSTPCRCGRRPGRRSFCAAGHFIGNIGIMNTAEPDAGAQLIEVPGLGREVKNSKFEETPGPSTAAARPSVLSQSNWIPGQTTSAS